MSDTHAMTDKLCEDGDRKVNMSETLHPNYQDILTEHYLLFSKYLFAEDFVDELISKAVLSPNDKEIILNQFVNQSRRQRATKLIDVLLTKGPKGYDCFIEMLEFQCPHVYKKVTQREPRPLPRGAQRNRHSDRLLLLENLPNLAHHIREQFRQNEELSMQLSVLEGLMKDSQVEKAELEKENEMLKSDAAEKTRELSAQKSQATKLQADVNKLHEDLKNEMERSHQIRDERDDLKQQVQDLRIERSQSRDKVKKETPQGSRFPVVPGREAHIVEQNKILREQLEEQIRHSEDLADRLCHLEDHASELQRQIIKLKTQLHKDEKERKLLEKEKAEMKKKNETYSDRIKQKNEELQSMEHQKLKAEGQIREMKQDSEKQQQKVDELEEQLQKSENELERLKLRLSRSSQEMSSSAEEGQEDGLERRKNIKGSYNGGKYTEKLKGRNSSEGADSDSDLERHLDCNGGVDLKSSTLPLSGKFSPEDIFRSEVAHFRWTIREDKNKRKQKVQESDSMVVEVPGSMKRKPQLCDNHGYAMEEIRQQFQGPDLTYRDGGLAAVTDIQNLQPTELMLQDDTPGRVSGPVVHSEDLEDAIENKSTVSSESSELRARKPASQPPCTLRDSGPYATVDPVRPHGNVRAICVSTELSDFPSHDVYSVLLPRSCSVVKTSGFEASSITVTVKQPILNDKFEIIGGNHTGIFISKVNKTCEVVTGDQIKEIIYTPSDRAEPVVMSLQGCTLDEVHNLLSQDWVRPKKEKEVKLSLGKFHPEYDSAKKWIAEHGGTGDYFYIRCNYEKNTQQQGLEGTILKPGEIFLVRDTRCEQRLWSGYKVNEVTGDRAQQETKIFNKNWARRKLVGVINRGLSNEEESDKRHLAFKFRGQVYERVLPMKASVKLPVILFGSDPLVEAMMNLISDNLCMQFTVENYDELSDPDSFELYRQDSHSVWKGKLDKVSSSQRHIQKIIFLLKITSETAVSALQGIFGSGFSMTVDENTISQGTYLKEKLGEKGLQIEELCFPEITSKERLLSKFHACVQSSQDRILWLSPSEMETSVAEKYLTYLGPDLSNVMTSLQNAQSQDFGSDC